MIYWCLLHAVRYEFKPCGLNITLLLPSLDAVFLPALAFHVEWELRFMSRRKKSLKHFNIFRGIAKGVSIVQQAKHVSHKDRNLTLLDIPVQL